MRKLISMFTIHLLYQFSKCEDVVQADLGLISNYCDFSASCHPGFHVRCNRTLGVLLQTCPSNATTIAIDPSSMEQEFLNFRSRYSVKDYLLNAFNILRAKVASGETGLPQASRMGQMQWDDELALMAEYKVLDCRFRFDMCRASNSFPYPGQNLGLYTTTQPDQPYSIMIDKILNEWFSRRRLNKWIVQHGLRLREYAMLLPFANVVLENNDRVGCAALTYYSPIENPVFHLFLVCNFPETTWLNESLYTIGPHAAGCEYNSLTYRTICSRQERYEYFTINGPLLSDDISKNTDDIDL